MPTLAELITHKPPAVPPSLQFPMFRLREEQQVSFLNASTTHGTVLEHAPLKGESQLAFRNDAPRWFEDGGWVGWGEGGGEGEARV